MCLLDEAVEWARRPSPLPMVPFNEFLDRVKPYAGPRCDSRILAAVRAGNTEANQ